MAFDAIQENKLDQSNIISSIFFRIRSNRKQKRKLIEKKGKRNTRQWKNRNIFEKSKK